ncbi:MAG: hypothetical protein L0Y54_12080, partial [Sporichthyaceae bacterium]|nr:hypothetical protein [Sporichthyaceae bacterium]
MDHAFWIDHDYDRAHASDGRTRYGAYLRQHTADLTEAWDGGPARFAALAWWIANSPVMWPGYVQAHPRVRGARLHHNDWDGSLT